MFTSCPGCHRQYRIHAGQLTAARGTVRCGFCGRQFNAVERLSDKPLPRIKPAPAKDIQQTETETAPADVETADEYSLEEPQFDTPEILRADEAAPVSKKTRILWSLGIFVLLSVAAIQIAWFNRDDLLEQYPDLRPWAEKICKKLQCELIRVYRTSEIKLLNRDVRLHPHYSDTLLVNATMANYSAKTQPYPSIQFSLFDTNGKMLASRQFNPQEYLDNSIIMNKGMIPNQPVHFVLEVTGPAEGAVSFEFRFL
jgi:predicted Zn finger-like uncharacterized protein